MYTFRLSAGVLLLAIGLFAAGPPVTAPAGMKVSVFQADAGVCQWVQTGGADCEQHITVTLRTDTPSPAVYRVTITTVPLYGTIGTTSRTTPVDSPLTSLSKMVVATDSTPSVTWPIEDVILMRVTVEVM